MNRSEETKIGRRVFLKSGSAMLLAVVLGASGLSGSETNIQKENHTMLPDANVVKDLMKQNLFGVFGERDAQKRRALIAEIWDSKGVFIDPHHRYVGHSGINEAVEQLQRRLPNYEFSILAETDAYSGVGRVQWGYGPPGEPRKLTGIDVLVGSDDRRIAALYTFVDAPKS